MTKYLLSVLMVLLLVPCIAACGLRRSAGSGTGDTEDTKTGLISPENQGYDYIEASEAPPGESPFYGIMHASVMEINGSINDTAAVYTLMDVTDPENVWSVTGLEVNYIDVEFAAGDRIAVFFNGDIQNDSENVEFLVMAPEGSYRLGRSEGVTTDNVMTSFSVREKDAEIVFVKDNCRMDERTLVSDHGERVIVYYAMGSAANYPLRVFSAGSR